MNIYPYQYEETSFNVLRARIEQKGNKGVIFFSGVGLSVFFWSWSPKALGTQTLIFQDLTNSPNQHPASTIFRFWLGLSIVIDSFDTQASVLRMDYITSFANSLACCETSQPIKLSKPVAIINLLLHIIYVSYYFYFFGEYWPIPLLVPEDKRNSTVGRNCGIDFRILIKLQRFIKSWVFLW